MKRSAPLKRGKPLQRKARLKARKVPKAFQKRRDPAYQAWIRTQPCLLLGRVASGHYIRGHGALNCDGIQACHVRSRGAGGDDRGNIVPMCAEAHEEQHRIGIWSFQTRWGLDLAGEAERLYQRYQQEQL